MNASFQAIIDTFTAPSQAFTEVRERRATSWAPLLLVLLSTLAVTTWYFTTVDVQQFLIDQMPADQQMSAEELAMAEQQMARFLPFSGLMPMLFIPLMYAVIALYLHMVAATASEAELKYGRWFALVSYAFLPTLVSLLTIAMNYLMAGDSYVNFAELDMTSLNNLLLRWPLDNPWVGMINTLSLTNIWTIALLIIGYRNLTQGGWGGAAATVLLPFAVIFGTWAGIILVGG